MKRYARLMGAAAIGIAAGAIGMTGLALAGGETDARAAEPAAQRAAAPAAAPDAATDARLWLHQAIADMSRGRKRAAVDRLERAETDLLNRRVQEQGEAADPRQPLPESYAMAEIGNARAALRANQLAQAQEHAASAEQAIAAEGGAPAE